MFELFIPMSVAFWAGVAVCWFAKDRVVAKLKSKDKLLAEAKAKLETLEARFK
jgi:hypothetical protein